MKFIVEHDPAKGVYRFSGEVTEADFMRIRLDPLERMAVGSPARTPADHLQTLEILFRRAQEQGVLSGSPKGHPQLPASDVLLPGR